MLKKRLLVELGDFISAEYFLLLDEFTEFLVVHEAHGETSLLVLFNTGRIFHRLLKGINVELDHVVRRTSRGDNRASGAVPVGICLLYTSPSPRD